MYQMVKAGDPKLQNKQSVERCVLILNFLRLVMQVVLPKETLCWLVYNGREPNKFYSTSSINHLWSHFSNFILFVSSYFVASIHIKLTKNNEKYQNYPKISIKITKNMEITKINANIFILLHNIHEQKQLIMTWFQSWYDMICHDEEISSMFLFISHRDSTHIQYVTPSDVTGAFLKGR
jgi:hypothetical protein